MRWPRTSDAWPAQPRPASRVVMIIDSLKTSDEALKDIRWETKQRDPELCIGTIPTKDVYSIPVTLVIVLSSGCSLADEHFSVQNHRYE